MPSLTTTTAVQSAAVLAWCAAIVATAAAWSDDDPALRALVQAPHTLTLPAPAGGIAGARDGGTNAAADRATSTATPPSVPAAAAAAATPASSTPSTIRTTVVLGGRRHAATAPAPGTAPVSSSEGGGAALSLDAGSPGTVPVIALRDARPGSAATMTLRVINTGPQAQPLTLVPGSITDQPGALGGLLSRRLLLRLSDGDGRVRASSPLTAAGPTALGAVPPRASRTWRVTLEFPDGGRPGSPVTGDNVFQGSGVGVRLEVRTQGAR